MFRKLLITIFGIWAQQVHADDGWCRASPQAGLPDYARCLPVDQAVARYVIELAPVVAFGLELKSDVKIVIEGSNGRRTKAISVASAAGGTIKRLSVDRVDVSDPQMIHAYLTSATAWACRQLTVWKDFRYWIFDCGEALSPLNPEASFMLSGSKVYELNVLTGTDTKGGAHQRARITLVGNLRSSGPKILDGNFPPGSNRLLHVQSADVGALEAIVLTNDCPSAPWFCKHITVRSGGTTASFKVSRWIGTPYSTSAYIPRYPSGLELASQDIDCHTRAADVIEGLPSGTDIRKVHCPMNCQASEFAHTQGSSLHPASSSICTSAILDGVLSPSGGDILITAVGPVELYTGAAYNGIESLDFASSPEKQQYSYHMYLVDTIDFINARVRLLDEFGQLSSVGRLEVKIAGAWGTVCNKGDFLTFSFEAAIKACQELGFKTGVPLLDGCKDVEGANLCAEKGYTVATAGTNCKGAEASLADCEAEKPPATCLEHNDDVVIKCTNNVAGVEPGAGTVRIVGPTGTPPQNGIGRLQLYNNGFGSICSDGWSLQSEQVACRQMGYSGVKNKGPGNGACSNIFGQNYCGQDMEKIVATNFSCTGREAALNQCPHLVSDDVYCVHEEDVVVACEGDGDPSGIGAFRREEAVAQKIRPLTSWHLTCFDTLETKTGLGGPPGATYHVVCPPNCGTAGGKLKGAFIYTGDSSICRAAIHSGTTTRDGGECIIVVAHAQKHFSALDNHGIQSEENGSFSRAFTVARVDRSLHTFASSPHGPKAGTPLTLPTPAGGVHTATSPSMQLAPASAQSNQAGALSVPAAGLNAPSGAAQVVPPATGHSHAVTSSNPTAHSSTVGLLMSNKEALLPQQRKERSRISKPRAIMALPSGHAGDPTSPTAKLLEAPAGVVSSVVEVKSQGSHPASSAEKYSRMIQVRSLSASQPEDIFHWFPQEGLKGFHGKPSDFIDVSSLAEGSVTSSIRDFTVAVKAAVTGAEGKWRTLVAHSDCDGFAMVIDPDNELIFEQTCHPHQLRSGFKPQIGEVFETAVTFSTTTRLIQLFVNGKPVASEKADFDISLRGRMVIGRASAAEADYFEGDILGVKLYNQEVQAPTIQSAFSPASLAAHIPQAPSETRRTDDGRLCLSACSLQIPAGAGAPVRPTKPAISLSCVDSLRRPEFNNFTGQKILAVCPPDCLHVNAPLEGCKVFTPRSSICKAGLHAGAVPKEGGELVVTLVAGLTSYEASQGHFGIRSSQSTKPELRSFVVETAPPFKVLSCDANGFFTIKLGVGERELIICPPGCMARVHVPVYGTGFYSPLSSVCRAAIHAGALNDVGGEVEIIASEARQRFAGSESFGVMSDSSGAYIRSFVFATANLRQQPALNSQPVASAGFNRPVLPHLLD